MTSADLTEDLGALRGRVRAAQHSRSVPLLVLGVLLVNYGSVQFEPTPVQWRYGAPLAFVAVWALSKVNESRIGVGTGRADYLVAAAMVFAATNVVTLRPISNPLRDFIVVQGIWTIIVGVALVGVALASRDSVLIVAGGAVVATGAFTVVMGPRWNGDAFVGMGGLFPAQPWTEVITALVGVALVLGGLVCYRQERAIG